MTTTNDVLVMKDMDKNNVVTEAQTFVVKPVCDKCKYFKSDCHCLVCKKCGKIETYCPCGFYGGTIGNVKTYYR